MQCTFTLKKKWLEMENTALNLNHMTIRKQLQVDYGKFYRHAQSMLNEHLLNSEKQGQSSVLIFPNVC